MMMTMTVTPDSNVDRDAGEIIDRDQIGTISFDWDRTVDIESVASGSRGQRKVSEISLFQDLVVVDGTPYRVLSSISQ